MMLNIKPGPLVLGFVLNPDKLLGVFVFLQLGLERLVRERIKLLDAQNGHIGAIGLGAGMHDIVVHLAGADQNALDRSEEHTSELQSLMRTSYAVFCLKKKKNKN